MVYRAAKQSVPVHKTIPRTYQMKLHEQGSVIIAPQKAARSLEPSSPTAGAPSSRCLALAE